MSEYIVRAANPDEVPMAVEHIPSTLKKIYSDLCK